MREYFESAKIDVTDNQLELFRQYTDFLLEYNKNVNLTRIISYEDIAVKHFIDSILILKYVEIPKNSSLIDVGTGAGFPGVPLKIMRPDLNITLLDSLKKRVVFLEKLAVILEISVDCVHENAVIYSRKNKNQYDFVTARAVASMEKLLPLCMPLLTNEGQFIALKGKTEEINYPSIDYNLPNGDFRRIVIVKNSL